MTTKTFPLTGPINLQARVGRGALSVQALDDVTEARVQITARRKGSDIAERYTVDLDGPTLSVLGPREGGIFDLPFFGTRANEAVDVVIEVPSGTAAKLSTFSADVLVSGRVGGADVATGSANITLDHVDGDLRVRYGNGTCTVARVSGSVEARSGAGRARFGYIDGSLNSACGSGELRVQEVRGSVRSRSGSGSASLETVHGDVDLASGSGPMSIGLPAGRPARLDVTTGSGQVRSDLPIEDAPRSSGEPITVRARTGSGDIRLHRAA